MRTLTDLVRENGFLSENGMCFGTYNDMHTVFKKTGDVLSVYLYLALPAAGRGQRARLEEQLNEKGERFGARCAQSGHASFLRIDFAAAGDDVSAAERYLNECDVLLRPYGREMGVLCAFCRRELGEEKPVYKREGDLMVPVCGACSALESGAGVKRAENRGSRSLRLTGKSAAGFAIGMIAAAVAWGFFNMFSGGFISYFFAIGCSFIIKNIFERFGGTFRNMTEKKAVAFLALASVFTILLGSAGGMTIAMTRSANAYLEEAERAIRISQAAGTENASVSGEEAMLLPDKIGFADTAVYFAQIFIRPNFYQMNFIPVIFGVIGAYLAGKQRYRR